MTGTTPVNKSLRSEVWTTEVSHALQNEGLTEEFLSYIFYISVITTLQRYYEVYINTNQTAVPIVRRDAVISFYFAMTFSFFFSGSPSLNSIFQTVIE